MRIVNEFRDKKARDLAENAAGRRHLVADAEFRDHLTLFLGALVLRTNEQKIKRGEQRDEEQHVEQAALGTGGAGRLRLSRIYEEIHRLTPV